MNYLDYFILLAVIIGFILGFKDGLIRKIIGLAGLVAGVFLAFQFSDDLGKFLNSFFNQDEYLSSAIAALLIFLVTILIASIIKRLVHPSDKINKFINQFIGGIIGIIQIIFFLSALFLFTNIFGFPEKTSGENSLLYNSVYKLIPSTVEMIIGEKSKASDLIRKIIEDRDKKD